MLNLLIKSSICSLVALSFLRWYKYAPERMTKKRRKIVTPTTTMVLELVVSVFLAEKIVTYFNQKIGYAQLDTLDTKLMPMSQSFLYPYLKNKYDMVWSSMKADRDNGKDIGCFSVSFLRIGSRISELRVIILPGMQI